MKAFFILAMFILSGQLYADGAMFYVDRSPPPVCVNEPDSSIGIVEANNHGRTGGETIFGDELACLQRNGLTNTAGYLGSNHYTNSDDLNRFYGQCTFIQTNQEFRDLERVSEYVHLVNRDRLINGLWQNLATRSSEQLDCRVRALATNETNASARATLNRRAETQFNAILERVRVLILSKRQINSRNQRDVFRRIDCSGLAWFFCNSVVAEQNRLDVARHEEAIAREIAKVPFGYEPDVANALVDMAQDGAYDPNKFARALTLTKDRYARLGEYYRDRAPDTAVGNGYYCIDREFKEHAVASGVASQLIDRYPENILDSTQKTILKCKLEAKYKTTEQNKSAAANIAFMAGGAAVAVLAAVPSGGSSVAAFSAVAGAGLSAASFAYSVGEANRECNRRTFLVTPDGREACNPEQDFQNEVSQYNATSCYTSVGMAALDAVFIPFDLTSLTRVVRARQGLQIRDLVDDVAISDELATIARTGNPNSTVLTSSGEAQTIIQVSGESGYTLPFSIDQVTSARTGLQRRGISSRTALTPEQVSAGLSDTERIYLVSRLTATDIPQRQADRLLGLLNSQPPLSSRDLRRRLNDIVSDLGVPRDEVEGVVDNIISRRFLESPPRLPDDPLRLVARTGEGAPTPTTLNRGVARAADAGGEIAAAAPTNIDEIVDAATSTPIARGFVGSADNLGTLRQLDDLDLSSVLRRADGDDIAGALDAAAEARRTQEDLARRFDGWDALDPAIRRQVTDFLGSVTDVEKRRQYLAILINARKYHSPALPGAAIDPTGALERLRRFNSSDPATRLSRDDYILELDRQMADLNARIRTATGTELENLTQARSALVVERMLIENGDRISIQSVYSANAHNAWFEGRRAGNHGHSLSDTFSMDIRPREGESISLCRGSTASAGLASNLVGGYLTICKDRDYLDNPDFTSRTAAPADVDLETNLQGYDRMNALELDSSQTISFGQNGPVTYGNGSGGPGGGAEFFTSRRGTQLSDANLTGSVRIPICRSSNSICRRILDIQASVRITDMNVGQARTVLEQQLRQVESVVGNASDGLLTAIRNFDDTGVDANLNRLARENPELFSALNLRREIELKLESLRAPGLRASDRVPLDSETLAFREYSRQSDTVNTSFRSALRGLDGSNFEAIRRATALAIRQARRTGAVADFTTFSRYAEREFTALRGARMYDDPAERLELIVGGLGRRTDAFQGVRGMISGISYNLDNIAGLTRAQRIQLREMITSGLPGRVDLGPIPD